MECCWTRQAVAEEQRPDGSLVLAARAPCCGCCSCGGRAAPGGLVWWLQFGLGLYLALRAALFANELAAPVSPCLGRVAALRSVGIPIATC